MDYFNYLYLSVVSRIAFFLEGKVNLKDIERGTAGGGTFSNVVTATTELSKDVYTTLMVIGGFGGVIMLIIAFLYFALAGNGNNKEQAKGKILTVLLAVAGIFAAVFIVGLAQSVGDALAGQQK